jgi:hypothetical protein
MYLLSRELNWRCDKSSESKKVCVKIYVIINTELGILTNYYSTSCYLILSAN